MTRARFLYLIVVAGLVNGCSNPGQQGANESEMHRLIVQSIRDAGINNAIVTQRTLYPYHFVADGPELNELGKRDLGVLAVHFKEQPGSLSVRRGSASEGLYSSRLSTVRDMLVQAGVDGQRIAMTDSLPGGAGMPADLVLQISRGRNSPSKPLYYPSQDRGGSGLGGLLGSLGGGSSGGGSGGAQ